jgi:hypothetical protein
LRLLLLRLCLLPTRLALLRAADDGARNRGVLGLILAVFLLHVAVDFVADLVPVAPRLRGGCAGSGARRRTRLSRDRRSPVECWPSTQQRFD